MIVLQFSAQRLPASWLIRQFTWSPYSHVDIVLPDGRLLGARGAEGVTITDQNNFSRVASYTVDAPAAVLDAAQIFAEEQIGKPYDWSAIFGMISRRNWQQPDRWFCSELVASAFQQAGWPLVNSETHRIPPRDLLLSPYLRPVTE